MDQGKKPTKKSTKKTSDKQKSYHHGASYHPMTYETLPDKLDEQAERVPDKEAHVFWMVYEGGQLEREAITFSVLAEKSRCIAAALIEMGIKKGDRILIAGDSCPEWLFVEYACLRIGVLLIKVPGNFCNGKHITKVVYQHRCRALIIEPGPKDALLKSTIKALHGVDSMDKVNDMRVIALHKPSSNVSVKTIQELAKSRKATMLDQVDDIQSTLKPDDVAVVVSSSGSSGSPKAISLSHFAYINSILAANNIHFQDPDTRFFNDRPFTWIGSAVYTAVCFGITMIHMDTMVAAQAEHTDLLLTIFIEEDVTAAMINHVMLTEMRACLKNGSIHLPPSLKYLLYGGEFLSHDLIQFCKENFRATIILYASSECFIVSRVMYGQSLPDNGNYCDLLAHVEVRITDSDGDVVNRNQPGKLWVRSPYLFRYYLDDKKQTQMYMDQGGWYDTNDLAQMNEKGNIQPLGRFKDIITKGDIEIYPALIEQYLHAFPKVLRVYVLGVPDKKVGQEVCACICFEEGHYVSDDGLRAYCKRQGLAQHAIPKYFLVLEEFPTLPNGKADRMAIIKLANKATKQK